MREHLRRLPAPTDWPRLTAENWRGALGVFLLGISLHVPLGCAVRLHAGPRPGVAHLKCRRHHTMLFGAGCLLAGYAGMRRIRTGLTMFGIGTVVVSLTIVLGG